ncbi:MAG: amidohydrolase family protein [Planctomycetota bacterium]|jgi:predicted TIM-barrel fold metal-dependent hydrolase
MIVDCHTHIQSSIIDIDRSEHLAAAESVDVCFILAAGNGPSKEINKDLSEYVNDHKTRMVGFAFIEPTEDPVSSNDIGYIKEKLALKGAVLYCAQRGFHPVHSKAMQFYESAQKMQIPVFFHSDQSSQSSVLNYAQPFLLDEIAISFPDLKIIVGNMGMPFVEQTLALLEKHDNVYADLTLMPNKVWQVYNTVVSAHECGVMEKLFFGSGFPSSKASECIETLLGFNKLLADTNLPRVPRDIIRQIVERDTLTLLGIEM